MAKSRKDKDIMILDAEQREVLAKSPARLEIVDAMSVIAPCSITELASELARTPQSLYYHVHMMVEAGLLIQTGTRKAGKRDEAVYDLAATVLRMVGDDPNEICEAAIKYNATILRLTERNFRQALDGELARRIGDDDLENLHTRRQRAWLTDDDLRAIHTHFQAINAIMREGNQKRKGQVCGLTTVLVPLHPVRDDDSESENADS